jgi:hypothetical protein
MWAVLHAFAVTLGSTFRARQASRRYAEIVNHRSSVRLGQASFA